MKTVLNLSPIPNQKASFNIKINDNFKLLDLEVRTLSDGEIIVSMYLEGVPLCLSRRAVNKIPLFFSKNIKGNFYFEDSDKKEDPNYKELGTRFNLIYDEE